jgi:hypothetical protein
LEGGGVEGEGMSGAGGYVEHSPKIWCGGGWGVRRGGQSAVKVTEMKMDGEEEEEKNPAKKELENKTKKLIVLVLAAFDH